MQQGGVIITGASGSMGALAEIRGCAESEPWFVTPRGGS
jgi:hypothetical protein